MCTPVAFTITATGTGSPIMPLTRLETLIMELKNCENRTVVVQVKKAPKEKQTYWRNHEKEEAEEA